jgi:hypothetical protein
VKNLAEQILKRAESFAKKHGGDAVVEMAEIIRAGERIRMLS